MPQKYNHNSKEKYSDICVGTFVPMHIKDIFLWVSVLEYEKDTYTDIKLSKEAKKIIVVDTSLHSLQFINVIMLLRLFLRSGIYFAFWGLN